MNGKSSMFPNRESFDIFKKFGVKNNNSDVRIRVEMGAWNPSVHHEEGPGGKNIISWGAETGSMFSSASGRLSRAECPIEQK